MDVHVLASVRPEREHQATLSIRTLMQRDLERLVDRQGISLRKREVLQGQQAARGVEDICILPDACCYVQAARASSERIVAAGSEHGRRATAPRQDDLLGTDEADIVIAGTESGLDHVPAGQHEVIAALSECSGLREVLRERAGGGDI